MSDLAVAWRDEQIDMLRQNMRGMAARIEHLQAKLDLETTRADRAEEALRILREEIRDAATHP